jgi:signal transduction histidine kinase
MDFRLKSLEQQLHTGDGADDLVAVNDTVHKVMRTLRVICGELRPPTLVPFGLAVAVRSHAEEFEAHHPDLEVGLSLASDGHALPERVRLALYRIYQQAMDNVAQHAGAAHILVRLALDDERVVLEVRDDGRGFEVPQRWITLARQGHLGLVGAAERAEAVGGHLEVQSEPGAGTTLRVAVPRRIDLEGVPDGIADSISERVQDEEHSRSAG